MPSVLDKCINLAEDPGPWMIMVYGIWGGGKTVLGAGCTDPLYLDVEKSRRSILNHPELQHMYDRILPVGSLAEFRALPGQIRGDDSIATVVLDTVNRLQRKDVVWVHKNKRYSKDEDLPSQAEFNASNRRIIQAIEEFFEKSQKNLLILCHDKEEKDDDGTTLVIRPGTSPALTEMLAQTVDGAFYLDCIANSKGEVTRTLKTVPTRKLRAKNRFGTLPPEITLEDNKRNFLVIEDAIEIQKQKALSLQKEVS